MVVSLCSFDCNTESGLHGPQLYNMKTPCIALYLPTVKVLYKGSVPLIPISRIHLYKNKSPRSQGVATVRRVEYNRTLRGNIRGDGAVLYQDRAGGYTTIHICQNWCNCTPPGANFTICFLKVNKIQQNCKIYYID